MNHHTLNARLVTLQQVAGAPVDLFLGQIRPLLGCLADEPFAQTTLALGRDLLELLRRQMAGTCVPA